MLFRSENLVQFAFNKIESYAKKQVVKKGEAEKADTCDTVVS